MNGVVAHPGCANGASKMPSIIARAPGDIAGRLWTLYWLARMTQTDAGCVVELGTREGDSTRAFLAACEDCQTELYSYDIENVISTVYHKTIEFGLPWSKMQERWSFAQKNSIAAGKEWYRGKVDLCFIDTDHTLATTRAEIAVWHPHVRVGGCMVFHDYWLNREPEGQGVKIAVDEFFGQHQEDWMLECHDAHNDTGLGILWHIK